MIVIGCGGRDYQDQEHVFWFMDDFHRIFSISLLVHGACGQDADRPKTRILEKLLGADRWLDQWARSRRVPVQPCPARWRSLGSRAGGIRNQYMLEHYNPDRVIAFEGHQGTFDMCKRAFLAHVEITKVPPCRK